MAPLPLLFIVLASTALLLALVALWSSLRRALAATSEGAPSLEGAELPDRAALLDEKKSLLRAIKDLEYEHAVGKISPEDFKRLDLAYRVRAKEVIALLEQDLAPYQAKAEALLGARAPHGTKIEEKTESKNDAKVDHDDDEALRERARQLREEADRLERRAAKTAKTDDASKPSEANTKPSEANTKPSEADTKPSEATTEPSEGSGDPDEVKPSSDRANEEVSS